VNRVRESRVGCSYPSASVSGELTRNPSHVNQSDYATEMATGEHARGIAEVRDFRVEVRIGRKEISRTSRVFLQVWLRLVSPGTREQPHEKWVVDESAGNEFVAVLRHVWLVHLFITWFDCLIGLRELRGRIEIVMRFKV